MPYAYYLIFHTLTKSDLMSYAYYLTFLTKTDAWVKQLRVSYSWSKLRV
jgi:hypothetical protein